MKKIKTVSFILGGATKAATSSLYELFRRHPGVAALPEEWHYFSQGLFGHNYKGLEQEITSWTDYYAKLPNVEPGVQIGDFDRLAMHGPNAPELIRAANPEMKIVLILRNPVDRAYSHYWMDVRECFESRPFLQAVREDYEQIKGGSTEYCSIVRLGFYAKQIRALQGIFPASQIRIWLYEDFCMDPEHVFTEMCKFIGIGGSAAASVGAIWENHASIPSSRLSAALLRARVGPLRRLRLLYLKLPHRFRRFVKSRILTTKFKPPAMSNEARSALIDIYKDDILELDGLLGRNLTHWLRDPDNPMSLPPEVQKAKQAEFFDEATDDEFEIERPWGSGRLYEWSIQSKFETAVGMLSFPLAGATLLDLCCGSGMASEMYANHGALVTGLDISERSVERARERARRHGFTAQFQAGDAEKLPFADGAFDIVAVHDGLHHLSDPQAAIAEMARVARKAVIVIEPARSWLTQRAVRAGLALDYEDAGNFVYRFREDEIYECVAKAGFVSMRYKQYMLYYRHEPFKYARLFEKTFLFNVFPIGFETLSTLAPRLGNKLCVVCERNGK